jgi:hypothetical protein
MNLNDKIKKHDLLIEGLNDNIDNLLNEGLSLYDVYKFYRNPTLYLSKTVIGKMIGLATDELQKKQDEIDDAEIRGEIKELMVSIKELQSIIKSLSERKKQNLQFNDVWLEFKGETKLDIPNFKPGFERDLIGTMKFKVVGIDEENKYMELKHESFGRKSIIKLYYNTLDTYVDQIGDASLIYSKHGDPDMDPVKGTENKVMYKITKKQ